MRGGGGGGGGVMDHPDGPGSPTSPRVLDPKEGRYSLSRVDRAWFQRLRLQYRRDRERRVRVYKEAQCFRPGPRERERDTSACMRRHQAFALPP